MEGGWLRYWIEGRGRGRGRGRGISFVYLTGRTGAIVYIRVTVAKRTACALRAQFTFFFGVGNCRLKSCSRRLRRIICGRERG